MQKAHTKAHKLNKTHIFSKIRSVTQPWLSLLVQQ